MKSIIPYENDKIFESKIAEITSISLEHEETITKESINGNFIISGDFKSHLISVNKEEFNYKIPFSIELPDNVLEESIGFDINDFTYEIKDNNTLSCKIEVALEFVEEESEREIQDVIDAKVVDDEEENTKDLDEVIKELQRDNEVEEIKEDEVEGDAKNIIMDNALNTTNTYVNYHIYIIKDNDNIDDIAKRYNVSKETIMEYNSSLELKPGNKMLIPEEYE